MWAVWERRFEHILYRETLPNRAAMARGAQGRGATNSPICAPSSGRMLFHGPNCPQEMHRSLRLAPGATVSLCVSLIDLGAADGPGGAPGGRVKVSRRNLTTQPLDSIVREAPRQREGGRETLALPKMKKHSKTRNTWQPIRAE